MALRAHEKGQEQSSTVTYSERSGRRVFDVYDDTDLSVQFTVIEAESAIGIPSINDVWIEGDPRVVTAINVKMSESRNHAVVEVEYGTPSGGVMSPLAELPVTWTEVVESDEEYFKDSVEDKCKLTNDKPFNPLPKRQRVDYKIITERNVPDDFRPPYDGYQNTVNSDAVVVDGFYVPAHKGRLILRLSKPQVSNGVTYRVYTKELIVSVSDEGHRQKFDSRDKEELKSGKLTPIVDDKKRIIDYSWPLNEDGTKAASYSTAPFTIERKPYYEVELGDFLNSTVT